MKRTYIRRRESSPFPEWFRRLVNLHDCMNCESPTKLHTLMESCEMFARRFDRNMAAFYLRKLRRRRDRGEIIITYPKR
jgi:hypothetical protein